MIEPAFHLHLPKAILPTKIIFTKSHLYPIVNHPGWVDDRHCHNGLWDYADENGVREIYEPLAMELARQQTDFGRFLNKAQTS